MLIAARPFAIPAARTRFGNNVTYLPIRTLIEIDGNTLTPERAPRVCTAIFDHTYAMFPTLIQIKAHLAAP